MGMEGQGDGSQGLGGARADFVASLGRKVADARKTLDALEGDPRSARERDELRRKVHALGTSARMMRFDAMAQALAEAEAALEAIDPSNPTTLRNVTIVARALDDLPALAWSDGRKADDAAATPAPPGVATADEPAPARTRSGGPPMTALVVGPESVADTLLDDPITVEVAPRDTPIELVHQLVYPVDRDRKEALLAHLVAKHGMEQLLVFTRTKLAASRLASGLVRRGIDAAPIHSDRPQAERTRTLEAFRRGEVTALVATDVAGRGLDIDGLPYVVNFELPFEPQDYIHRIGRTGRAGAEGEAISLVCIDEVDLLRAIQRMLRQAIPWAVEDGFIPDRNAEPRPIRGHHPAPGHHRHHQPTVRKGHRERAGARRA